MNARSAPEAVPGAVQRVMVTGAGGFIGGHLCAHLARTGTDVVAMRRGAGTSPATAREWQAPADLRQVGDANGWPLGLDAVVHLAAANPARGEPGSGDEAFLRGANVESTIALARRSAREGVRRFVFLSTANVHAPRADGGAVTEDDPIAPQSPYAGSKAEAEAALAAELGGTRTQLCILRPTPVFGRGGRGTVAQLARIAATPLPLPLKGLGGRRSLVSVDDLVRAIAIAIDAPAAAGQTLLLAGGAASPAEIVEALRRGAGRTSRLLPAPTGALALLARGLGKARAFDSLRRDFVIDTARAEAVLGWRAERDLASRLHAEGAAQR